jgi:glycyl-tRNA synthetase beta chain
MPQLLLEIFSEEIPARMQAQAAKDLERMARERLAGQGLLPAGLKTFSGPRRLTLVAEGLPPAQADRSEERKGPRVGAPDQAVDGFLRSTGLTRDQLVERDGVWFAQISRPGRPTPEIAAEIVGEIIRGFPWPKSMRWGTGTLRWVRPIQRILLTFDGEVVPFEIEGIQSGDLTEGHRFMGSRAPFRARTFDAYAEGLQKNFVVLDPEERKQRILQGARTLCFARNLELIEDPGLLDEVAGLAEWPVPILGDMDPSFLDLPPEVIRTSMRTHQKYFAVRDPKTGALAPHFLAVANIEAVDGGKAIAEGNARVLSARLNDARFFWDEDCKVGFEPWLEKLKGVTFHAKLGTMAERVERITALAREIAPLVGADPDKATEAARLAKADLASGMVGEFPELQGIMGGYYAREAGLDPEIADAVRDHYKPQGPNEAVPTAPVTVAVALADKLDMLVGFFAIDEKPTGSKDPFALRRAALGVLRILLEDGLRLQLPVLVGKARRVFLGSALEAARLDKAWIEIVGFLKERTRVALRDRGLRPDVVEAARGRDGGADVVVLQARVDALDAFLKTDDGANLLAGYKRATNILKAEEKKKPDEAAAYAEAVDPGLLAEPEERALHDALRVMLPAVATHLRDERFEEAMTELAALRAPVDAFFDKVLVNAEDPAVRINRLRLLSQARKAMGEVADFSQVAG